jgi:hypothetical protein
MILMFAGGDPLNHVVEGKGDRCYEAALLGAAGCGHVFSRV